MTMMTRRPEYTVRGEVLGAELRRLREAAGLTLMETAERIGISHSHLSKMETGRRTASLEDVASLCTVFQVFGQDRRDLFELTGRAVERGLWRTPRQSFGARAATLRPLESRATALFAFETVLVPGYLQTVPYMRAVMRGAMIEDEDEIGRRVAARLQRQSGIRRRRVELTAVVCESALRAEIGGTAVMRDQLRHLVEVADLPGVWLRVVPTSAGAHPGLSGPFVRLRFPDRPGVVFAGCVGSSLFLEEEALIEHFKLVSAELATIAMSHDESVALAEGIAAELGEPHRRHPA